MSLTADSIVVQDSEPVAARVDSDVVMLSERAGAYFGLNGVGSRIWDLIAEPQRVVDVCRSLSELYEADDATLLREVTTFLEAMVARNLVRVVDPRSTAVKHEA